MDLGHLRTYLAVVDHGSFHAAARALGISQPAVSQHVRKLERAVEATLLVRTRLGCQPPPEAADFIRLGRSLLALADRTRHSLRRRDVRIGASSNIGTFLLPPRFHRLCVHLADAFPFRLRLENNREVARLLEAGEIDVALMEWWDRRPGFRADLWRTEELVALLPVGHPLASAAEIDPADLARYPLLGGEPATGTATLLRERLGSRADALQTHLNLGSTQAVKEAVRSGLGLSLVLAAAFRPEQDAATLVTRPLQGRKLAKSLYLIRPLNLPAGHPIETVAHFLLADETSLAASPGPLRQIAR